MKQGMKLREWVICLIVCFCISFLFLTSTSFERPFSCDIVTDKMPERTIKVVVSGAVSYPGEYQVEVGTSLRRILKQARLASIADRRALYSKKVLLNSCEIFVPEKGGA